MQPHEQCCQKRGRHVGIECLTLIADRRGQRLNGGDFRVDECECGNKASLRIGPIWKVTGANEVDDHCNTKVFHDLSVLLKGGRVKLFAKENRTVVIH